MLRNLGETITDRIQQNHRMMQESCEALLTIMMQFRPNWSVSYPGVSYPGVSYPAGIQEELLCGNRHLSTITPQV